MDYGAAKAAVINLTKALSEEFAPQGVAQRRLPRAREDTVVDRRGRRRRHPCRSDGLGSRERDDHLAPEMMQLVTGRLADPKEIAFAVAFLASPRSASTTGAEFVVDSGMLKTS